MVSLKLSRNNEAELDLLAWNAAQALFLEIKGEALHPGELGADRWDTRRSKLSEWQGDLARKAQDWSRPILQGGAEIEVSGREVTLPRDFLAGRQLRAALISMRLEPRPGSDEPRVRTYMPPLAQTVADEVFPEDVARFWNGEDLLFP